MIFVLSSHELGRALPCTPSCKDQTEAWKYSACVMTTIGRRVIANRMFGTGTVYNEESSPGTCITPPHTSKYHVNSLHLHPHLRVGSPAFSTLSQFSRNFFETTTATTVLK